MEFTPFMWFVEAASIVLQLSVFFSGRGPMSFRYLMLFLTVGNVLAIATHDHPILYWDTLWIGRGIGMCWFLWVVGSMFSDRPHLVMRFPVAMNAALFFIYWPMSQETTLEQLEVYRSFGFGLALAIAVIGFVALVPKGEAGPLHVGLIAFLAAEFSAALIGRIFAWAPEAQLLCWVVSMSALVATSRTSSGGLQNRPPAPLPALISYSIGTEI